MASVLHRIISISFSKASKETGHLASTSDRIHIEGLCLQIQALAHYLLFSVHEIPQTCLYANN